MVFLLTFITSLLTFLPLPYLLSILFLLPHISCSTQTILYPPSSPTFSFFSLLFLLSLSCPLLFRLLHNLPLISYLFLATLVDLSWLSPPLLTFFSFHSDNHLLPRLLALILLFRLLLDYIFLPPSHLLVTLPWIHVCRITFSNSDSHLIACSLPILWPILNAHVCLSQALLWYHYGTGCVALSLFYVGIFLAVTALFI